MSSVSRAPPKRMNSLEVPETSFGVRNGKPPPQDEQKILPQIIKKEPSTGIITEITSSGHASSVTFGPVCTSSQRRRSSMMSTGTWCCWVARCFSWCRYHGQALSLLICLIVIVVTAIVTCILSIQSTNHIRPNLSTVSESQVLKEGRCFSMCEPDDLMVRDDKLMKPVVIHNGFKPVRYFLYLFPPEPEFTVEEVGEPLKLTPLIISNRLSEAREKAEVKGLQWPGLISYAGFLTVNPEYDSNLYFWFFPSQSNPSEDPVILWLQGGPGATSLFGLFKENGPIKAFAKDKPISGEEEEAEEKKLRDQYFPFEMYNKKLAYAELNPYSWNRNASVLYIDNPVGTGFSYTNDDLGYPNFVNQSSEDLYVALQQFFTIFPDYAQRDFYIFGESYGGKYVPALSHRIHIAKKGIGKGPVDINLKGIGIGNGWMSPLEQGKYASFLYYHGLLDTEQFFLLRDLEETLIDMIAKEDWFGSWMASDQQLHFVLQSLNYSSLYDLTHGQFKPSTMDFWYWMQQPHVRKAMNLGNKTLSDGLEIYKAMIEDTMQSIKPELVEAMENYKVLIYHGALDIICHFPGAQEMLAHTNWTGKEEFQQSERRALWVYNEETMQNDLAGYVKGDGNLKLMLVRNAGHSVPMDQPQWTLRILESFIKGNL